MNSQHGCAIVYTLVISVDTTINGVSEMNCKTMNGNSVCCCASLSCSEDEKAEEQESVINKSYNALTQTWGSNSTDDQYSKNIRHLPITQGRGELKSG